MKIQLPSFLRRKSHSPAYVSSSSSVISSSTTSASSAVHMPLSVSHSNATNSSLQAQKSPFSDLTLTSIPLKEGTGNRFIQERVYLGDSNLELREVFKRFDVNGDGKISVMELGSILRSLGDEPSDKELLLMVKDVDRDGDGFIDLEEFILLNTASSSMESQGLWDAFQVFDTDADGKISAEELHSVLLRLGESCTVEECGRMIRGVDTDGDGYVDFKEFCDMMTLPQ